MRYMVRLNLRDHVRYNKKNYCYISDFDKKNAIEYAKKLEKKYSRGKVVLVISQYGWGVYLLCDLYRKIKSFGE